MENITFITSTFLPEINGVTVSLFELIKQLYLKLYNVKVVMPNYKSIAHLLNMNLLHDVQNYCTIDNYPSSKFGNYPYARKPKPFSLHYNACNEKIVVVEPDRLQIGNIFFPVKNTGHAFAFMRQDYFKAAELYYSSLQFRISHPFLRRFISWTYNNYSKVFVLSEYAKEILLDIGVKTPVSIIKQGLNHDIFVKQKPIAKDLPLRITFIGRVSIEKNLQLLFDSLDTCFFNKNNIEIHIVGDGPLKEMYENTYNYDFVIYHGFKSQKEIVSILSESHFVINTCLCETFGNTVVEAMACGKPVIGVNSGAVINHLNKNNGFIINNNSDELRSLLIDLINNDINYQELCEGAYNYSLQYSWEIAAENFINNLFS